MLPPNTYKVDDFETIRQTIFDDALNSLSNRFPLENDKYRLTVEDLGYDSIPKYTTLQQKEAVQSDKTLSAKIKGRWTLYDKNTGKIVSQSSRKTIMDVPYMTERGTFIRNGTEMTLPIQMRLVPGVYARMTDSGEAKAHINVKPGSGSQLSITMNPANPVFKVTQGTRNYKLYPLLKHMGISDEYLMNAWGKDIYKANYDDFISGGGWYSAKTAAEENPYDEITKRVFRGDLDPLETEASLGKGYKTVDPDMMVAAASKLLRISKGEAESDNRDSLENQRFLMAPELIGERVRLDAGKVGQTLLWKISRSGDVNKIPAGALNKYINGLFTESRLAQAIEETNPLDAYMRATKVTRMGEGGISGVDTAPMSARLVHNTYKGFIDPTVSPESLRAGLDSAIALNAVKGKDGFMYTPMINAISGRREYVNSLVASKVPVAFSEYRDSTQKYIPAMVGNKIEYLPKANVKYFIPNGDSLFALSSNLIPLKSGIKAGRLLMAQKHQTQAVSLSSRMAPYVQTEHPGDNTISVEKSIGKLMGAVFSKGDGKVLSVTPDEMTVRYNDGTKETISLYNNYPLNRKSYYHNESRVKPGDIIKKGQVLASSNYTDENGVSALGTQLRTAWMPFKGENYLDAIIVSEDAAKKLSSEHLYHTGVDKDSTTTIDKNAYTSAFPTKFNKDQLATIDKDGIVKPGTTVKFGDPLILSYSKREATPGSLHRALVKDNVVTWEHEFPGYITDVVNSSKGVKVYTKAYLPLQTGDKCAARYANKGVTARVVPTSEMPIAADGKPIDVIFGPTGIVSRVNSAQLVEAMLGKVAAKTGKRYVLPGFMNENMVEFAKRELAQAGLTDREDLTDPTTGITIPQITVGNSYIVKMHHTAESKGGARATGAYTMDELPGGQGHDGSKLLGNLILGAIIGHGCFVGSTNILTDRGYMEIGNIVKRRLPVNVYSYNKETDSFEYRPVTNWFVYTVDDSEMWEIQTTLNDSPIRCTKDHKFYTPNGLIKASNLQCNDPVYVGDSTTISGPELSYVTKSAPYNRPDYDTSLVYDITVEHNHNFIAAGVLVSNSTEVLKDMKLVKGQKNTDFWRDFKLGRTPVMPSTPLIYDKFIASLQGAGINVHKEKNTTNIFALTNKDINDFAHAEVKNSDTYSANNMAPLPGGLFDPNIFGPNGTQWGYIKLDEPVLNPVMEDPIKLILGLTEADLEAVISGNKKLPNGLTGGLGLKKQLESINMKQAVQDALNDVKNATRTKRDKAVKKYRYLSSMLKHNASPADFMLDKIPVIPPRFRRISQSGDLTMVADANYLYRALMDNQQDVRDARNAGLPEDMVGSGNLKIYKAFKAITGLSDPEDRKLQEKQVSGLLKWVFGKGSPKCYDSETEILTENGWVKFPEYLDSTIKVATLNPSTDAFEWQTPTDIIHIPYSGDMIYTHTRYLDSMVTPNHNHYVSLRTGKGINSRWTPFTKEQASNLVDVVKRVRYKTAASKYIGSTPNTFDITPNANAFATFIGWYAAEGWIHTDNTIVYIAVKAHGRDESILTDLFDNNAFKYKKAYYTTKAAKVSPYGIKTPAGYEMVYFSFYSKELCQWLKDNVGASCYTKHLSHEILGWSSEYLINVWEGFHAGDGEKRSGLITTNSKKTWQSRKSFTDRGNRAYTVSKALAESFVELGLKIGASVNYVKNKEVYRISVHAFDYSVAEYRHQTSKVPYDGMVHCVTVPNGLVFVRRNGRVLVSGNSGAYQRNVVGGSLDVAGRNVITPNASFRLDEIGLPKKEAWTLYQDFVIRRLVQNGMDPLVATKEVTNKTKLAEDALRQVVSERPVLATRAPALHKYSIMAFRPRLVESETLQLNPAIQKPFNADHDGDSQVGRVIVRFKRNVDVPFKYRLDF